jgi:hypothetical protein
MRKIMIAAALAASASAPAFAQVSVQPGLVNVTVQDVSVLNDFLNDDQIAALNALNVPVVVQAPIGVAANVCGVSAAVLGKAGSAAACDAKSGSKALAQVVNRQMLDQKKMMKK